MKIVIQKYGGTSVSSDESRELIVENIKKQLKADKKVVVVVSAMGRAGDPYATDTLIQLIRDKNPMPEPRTLDFLMSCGEVISSAVLANTLDLHGLKSIPLTGLQAGILTTSDYNNADILQIDPRRILSHLEEDYVVIVTGFQGMSPHLDITTLGRGGSDASAAALGEALNAERIEIYTDVDGIMTADPRTVNKARILQSVTYDEVYHMSIFGAKVIDHKAVSIAQRANKPLVIKNTFSSSAGTVIGHEDILREINLENKKMITAVTSHDHVRQIKVETKDSNDGEILLNALDRNKIPIDMINFFEERKIFAVSESNVLALKGILNLLDLTYSISEECSKITIIGYKIFKLPGVIKKTLLALSSANINILQSTDSNTSISFLVERPDMERAVQILHETFDL